jgi:uncharacterized delta-60 repeat protein/uncharacterized repeat protein (TIGR01451 family)
VRKLFLPFPVCLALLGIGLHSRAASPPPNDNFTNAQGLAGVSGSVIGSNVGATAEKNEPPSETYTGNQAGATIWYTWTCPVTSVVNFNTRGSYTTNVPPAPLPTVISVYTLSAGSVASLTNLSLVNANAVDDNTNAAPDVSRVYFEGIAGTTYYIQVDGKENLATGSYWEGNIVLNWGPNPFAGEFMFTSPVFDFGQYDDEIYIDAAYSVIEYNSIYPSLSNPDTTNSFFSTTNIDGLDTLVPEGRVTITRVGGAAGRCMVDLTVAANNYTNIYFTNAWDVDVEKLVVSPDGMTIMGYTNVETTNIDIELEIQYDSSGVYPYLPTEGAVFLYSILTNSVQIVATNENGNLLKQASNYTCGGYTKLPDQYGVIGTPVITTNVDANSNIVSYLEVFTNITVDENISGETNVITPAAADGVDFFSSDSQTVTFDDFQMSKDVFLTISPEDVSDLGGADYPDNLGNLIVYGVNRSITLTLSNPRLDPLESLDIIPPFLETEYESVEIITNGRIATNLVYVTNNTADMVIQDYYTEPDHNPCNTNTRAFNFNRPNFRCRKDVDGSNITIWVHREGNIGNGDSVMYYIDGEPLIALCYQTFPTEAGSDYAIGISKGGAGNPTNNWDFELPYSGVTGTVSFAANIIDDQPIAIPINNSGAVEFNEDFYCELYQGTKPPANEYLGDIATANVTILFDDTLGGQQPGGAVDRTWDMDNAPPAYNAAPGANAQVNAIALQPNGMSIIGGDFTLFNNSQALGGLVRATRNGLVDASFNPPQDSDGSVLALAVDSNGKIIVAGSFSSFTGNPGSSRIIRLNYDGSVDGSFSTGGGADGAIRAVALDASGNILIAGDFANFNSIPVSHLARLLPSGALDTTFNPGAIAGKVSPLTIYAVSVDSLNNIVIGGSFTSVNGTNSPNLARLLASGALDTTFQTGIGVNGPVYSLAVQPNNQIVIGGSFSQINFATRTDVARLNFNGGLDTNFNANPGPNNTVYAVAVQPDGAILVGGQFTSIGLVRRVGYARLLPSGWVDPSFLDTSYNQFAGLINQYFGDTNSLDDLDVAPGQINTPYQPNYISAIALDTNSGNVMIGGSFTRIGGGFTRDDIRARLNVARVIGAPTPGPMADGSGIGNNPGTITFTEPAYNFGNLAGRSFINIQRVNGSLGMVTLTMGTNTLPPGSGAATSADFSLLNDGFAYYGLTELLYGPNNYGWRGEYTSGMWGPNNSPLPSQLPTNSQSAFLYLNILNDPKATGNLAAGLSLLSVSGHDLMFLGGEETPTEPTLGLSSAQLNIIYPPPVTSVTGFSATNYPVVESAGAVTITVVRTNGSTGTMTVNYKTEDGFTNGGFSYPAIHSVDYIATNGTLTLEAGFPTATFNVQIIDHSTLQSNKFFNVVLSSPSGATFDTNNPPALVSNSVVTIVDDHFSPGHLSFNNSTFTGTKGGVSAITVNRTGGGLGTISATVVSSNLTASNGINYLSVSNTLIWGNSNIAPQTITVTNLEDGIVEGTKTMLLTLINPVVSGNPSQDGLVLINPTNATNMILDDDFYGQPAFVVPNFNVLQSAGSVLITVVRVGGTNGTVTVNYSTANGTNSAASLNARAGTNYGLTSGSLSFAPNITAQSFTVPIFYTPNETNAANRTFNLILSGPNPLVPAVTNGFPKTATVTILDNQLVPGAPGTVDTTTQTGLGFNGLVQSVALQPDGKVLAGGNFSFVNNYPLSDLARLNTDGSVDSSFLSGQAGADGTVCAVLSQSSAAGGTNDGPIVLVGDFTNVDSVPRHGIARLNLNGSLDSTFNPGFGADSGIYAIIQMPTNQFPTPTFVIGGNFANYDGTSMGGVARITTSGQLDPTFNPGPGVTSTNGAVHALALQANGQVIVGGDFTVFNSLPYHHLVRLNLDGSVDTTFNPDTGADISGSVQAILVQPDGKIVIGGVFTNVNGVALNHIARLNQDGTLDPAFNVGVGANNTVIALALDSQQRILVAGQFTTASGVSRNGITRLNPDGTVDPTINFGAGANGYVNTIAIQANDEINLGGLFTSFGGVAQNNFTRLFGGAVTGPGVLNFSQPVFGALQSQSAATVTVQRSGGTGSTNIPVVSVVVSTSDNTALAGVDYVGVTNIVNFPLGEPFGYVTIPLLDTGSVGPDKSVNLNLSNPVAATLGSQPTAQLVITNVNAAVAFSAASYRQAENIPGGNALIPVVRVGSQLGTFTVTVYTGSNGTAIPGVDYTPQTNVLTFPPGILTNLFVIPLLDNPKMFNDATVDLELANPTNCFLVSPSQSTLTIATVNAGPGIVAFSQTNYLVSEAASSAPITLVRTNGVTGTVSVTLSTSPGTAVAGVNYSNISQVVTFSDSQSSQTVSIPVISNSIATADTTVNLILSNAVNTTIGGSGLATLTIQNDIQNFTFGAPDSSPDYFVSEGGGSITLAVYRNGPTNGSVSVSYATSSPTNASITNGFAVPGTNYIPISGILNFAPGQTFQTIPPITIRQGVTVDGPLAFQVVLTNASAGTQIATPGIANVTIEGDVTGFSLVTNSYVVGDNAGSVVVTVNRQNVDTGNVSINFATANGTALAGFDYVATNGILAFTDGQATNTVTIPILNPNVVEGDKSFTFALSNPVSASSTNCYLLSPSNAVVKITNVLTGLNFSSSLYSLSETNYQALINVIRTGVTATNVSVSYATSPGTAVPGKNYLDISGTLNFAEGVTNLSFPVTVIDDHVIDGNHTVNLTLSNPQGAVLEQPNTAVLNILEGDGSYIGPDGTLLLYESDKPTNGIIDPGETVTVAFGMRCISGGSTTNLIAVMQTNAGVTPLITSTNGPTNNYGVLIQGGSGVSRPFTFIGNGTNSQVIAVNFMLYDGLRPLTNVVFSFTLGSTITTFANSAAIIISNSSTVFPTSPAAANPYPSIINVSGLNGNIGKITATFSNLNHSSPSDIQAVLVTPAESASPSQNILLMADVGGGTVVSNLTITFDDAAANFLSVSQLPSNKSVTNKPTGYVTIINNNVSTTTFIGNQWAYLPFMPSPVLLPPYATNLFVVDATPANGIWSLYVADTGAPDTGVISNGWALNISAGNVVPANADLQLAVTIPPTPVTVSNVLTYTIAVTNYGPAVASGVVISNVVPSGLTYLSNNFPGVPVIGPVMTFGATNTLAISNGLAFNLYMEPGTNGLITNTFVALANQVDPNTNNLTNVVTDVNSQSADLAVILGGSPNELMAGDFVLYSVEITNAGPSAAVSVLASNVLPNGMAFLSSSPSSGVTNSGGVSYWGLTNLDASSNATLFILAQATATNGATVLDTAGVTSSIYDPVKLNNYSSYKTVVDPAPLLSISNTLHGFTLVWPGAATNFALQGATNLPPPGVWTTLTNAVLSNSAGQYSITLTNQGYRFFILRTKLP